MVSTGDKWIRIFDVPDTSKHKKGFTIYKIISMLYPEACPDAVTRITVWKRFNDFKTLHKEMKVLHKSLKLKDRFPTLPNSRFFKRFDEQTIETRRVGIMDFLDFIAGHSQLFTSSCFVKFFQTSHIPNESTNGSISNIRAELSLPTEEFHPFHSLSSDEDKTLSDTDSVSTMSSTSQSAHVNDSQADPFFKSTASLTRLSKRMSSESSVSSSQVSKSASSHDSLSISGATASLESAHTEGIFPTPPRSPGYQISAILSPSQYILEASKHINLAAQYEADEKFEDAFCQYKLGIDILLKNGKEDKNIERKELVRFKTEKYLLRAEKIYNIHLSSEMKTIKKLVAQPEEKPIARKPLSELYKFKVVKVMGSGMLVLHCECQILYYMKVIYKTTTFSNDNLILPEKVPYMVKIHNFYNCENAVFLVLEYCSGVRLLDHLKQRSITPDFSYDNITRKNLEGNESDDSYSDLVRKYTISKDCLRMDRVIDTSSSVDSFEQINFEDVNFKSDQERDNFVEDKSLDTDDLVEKSQKLLSSVHSTLHIKPKVKVKKKKKSLEKQKVDDYLNRQRKYSDKSSCDELEDLGTSSLAPLDAVVKWAAQIVIALEKLHSLGVFCGDLHMKNVLINEQNDILLTYMSKQYETFRKVIYKDDICLAPELYTPQNVSEAADWWSLGAILYELLVGISLNKVYPDGPVCYMPIKVPRYVCAEGRSLLKQLLTIDPQDRLGCGPNGTEDIKSHPFFSSINWKSLLM